MRGLEQTHGDVFGRFRLRRKRGLYLSGVLRYSPIVDFIVKKQPATILDVGSGPSGVSPFVHGPRVTLLDVLFDSRAASDSNYVVIGSMVELPFSNSSYDLVMSCHAFEHLSDHLRRVALAEMLRVAKRWVVVSCPTGRNAEQGDSDLAHWFTKERKPVPPWLEDHLQAGLPDLFRLGESYRGKKWTGYNMSVELNNFLVRLESVRLLQVLSAVAAQLAPRLANVVLRWMLSSDRCYDAVLIIFKEGGPSEAMVGGGLSPVAVGTTP